MTIPDVHHLWRIFMHAGMMARNLDLYKPRYLKTAAYGHFGREGPEFTWEKVIKL